MGWADDVTVVAVAAGTACDDDGDGGDGDGAVARAPHGPAVVGEAASNAPAQKNRQGTSISDNCYPYLLQAYDSHLTYQ